MKNTKGIFEDGHQGWRVATRKTQGVKGFEIHYSDDGECVTDHVYVLDDAVLIAEAPSMLSALHEIAEAKGRFALERLAHAENTIQDMQKIALDTISRIEVLLSEQLQKI